jgi:hypothetical protein
MAGGLCRCVCICVCARVQNARSVCGGRERNTVVLDLCEDLAHSWRALQVFVCVKFSSMVGDTVQKSHWRVHESKRKVFQNLCPDQEFSMSDGGFTQ